MRYIDLRSDTVTQPTEAMRKAMLQAQVGDDVYGEDTEINALEAMAAQITGKEAALFVPSGTMGNQLAIMTHTRRGDEIIAGAWSHVVHHEVGAAAVLSAVSTRVVDNPDKIIYPADVRNAMRSEDIHEPRTSLLCLENALANGDVVPLEILRETYQTAKALNLNVHMDGARLFNAAVSLKTDVKDIAACTDSVMFCLSKGLCAPVGSMLCGTNEFILRARKNRKLLGGGMRQAGFLAAAGRIALETMTQRLQEDHANARYLAEALAKLPEIQLDPERVKINMVFFTVVKEGFSADEFADYLLQHGIKNTGYMQGEMRLVTHHGISRQDLDTVIALIKAYFA
jgi:threonine aldolase